MRQLPHNIVPSRESDTKTSRCQIGGYTFLLSLYEYDSSYSLYIGENNVYYIDATVFKDTNELRDTILDPRQASINNLYYASKYKTGVEPTLLLKYMISYIQNTYSYVTSIFFSSNDSPELSIMTYLHSGKTWYENNLGAYIEELPFVTEHRIEAEKRFQAKKSKCSWQLLSDFISVNPPIDETILESMYSSATTWQEFFRSMYIRLGESEYYIFLSQWLHRFMLFEYSISSYYLIIPLSREAAPYMTPTLQPSETLPH